MCELMGKFVVLEEPNVKKKRSKHLVEDIVEVRNEMLRIREKNGRN